MSGRAFVTMPYSRTSSTLCVRALPELVQASVSHIIHRHLQEISEYYNLKRPTSNFHGPAPTAKVIQWMASDTLQYYQATNHRNRSLITPKRIRVREDPMRPAHYVVSLRILGQGEKKRFRKTAWAPFWLVRSNTTPFTGDVHIDWVDGMGKGDANEKRFRTAFTSYYGSPSPGTCDIAQKCYSGFLSWARPRGEASCQSMHDEMDGGHFQRCQISDMCREMSITPHRWKGSRHVHSFVDEWPLHRSFMKEIGRLNTLLEHELPYNRHQVIQVHISDKYPPIELVTDWCDQWADYMARRLLAVAQSPGSLEPHQNAANIRILENHLQTNETINNLFNRMDNLRSIDKKARKVLAVCKQSYMTREDPGACLWTHR